MFVFFETLKGLIDGVHSKRVYLLKFSLILLLYWYTHDLERPKAGKYQKWPQNFIREIKFEYFL